MTSYMPVNPTYEFADGSVEGTGGAVDPTGRRSHVMAGICCDCRRGVLIVNIVMISLLLITDILLAFGYEIIEQNAKEHPDDMRAQQDKYAIEHAHIWWIVFFHGLQILCYGIGMYGALKFDRKLVLVALVCYALSAAINIVSFNWVALVLNLLFAYPHYFLQKDIGDNIMTPESYVYERYCC